MKDLRSPPIAPIEWNVEVLKLGICGIEIRFRGIYVARTAFDAREQAAIEHGVTRSDVTVLPMGQKWPHVDGLVCNPGAET